jgi:hypothetical protein
LHLKSRCSATIRTPGRVASRIDSPVLLPVKGRCLIKMLPVSKEWSGINEEAAQYGSEAGTNRSSGRTVKEPLLVKYDPRNISRLYIRDAHGKHWPIPYSDLGQPPVALWEILEARNRLREKGRESNLSLQYSIPFLSSAASSAQLQEPLASAVDKKGPGPCWPQKRLLSNLKSI